MTASGDRLIVLYDADCRVCRVTVRTLRSVDWRRRLAFTPLQQFAASAPSDPTRRQLLAALHVRDGGGRWYRGGVAMLRIASVIPILVPLSIIGRLPGMSAPAETAYRLVADNRHSIGRALDALGRAKRPHSGRVTTQRQEPRSMRQISRDR